MELKDLLWKAITDESNRIEPSDITHRPLDGHHRVREEDEFIFTQTPEDDDDAEGEDLRNIDASTWGEDMDWDDADVEETDAEDEEDHRAYIPDEPGYSAADDDDAFIFESINDK